MTESKIYVGHKVRAIREIKGISQEYLAGKLGVSQPALSKMESNETMMSYETVLEISKILEIDVNDILNFDKANIFTNCNQSGTFAGANNTFTFNGSGSTETIDQVLAEKEQKIVELTERIRALEKALGQK